ncbi:hypothetical protein VitviT2T_030648 [Vitis vinifera]|uniref:Uncharacterized protein n=1 Tax=Vitis vinifera TaxID=29760 RepID=A0ABY9E1L4_VITVI|nr:hypothetical protein VitviT2T_030648 [Vitis vinifera]
MRTCVAHNVDGNEDLLANLKTTKSEVVATQELAEEGVGLLRKVEEEKEASQAEAGQLVEENVAMVAEKEKIEEKDVRLRQELQDTRTGFDSLYLFTLVD